MSDLSTPWAADALVRELLGALAVPAWLHRDGQPVLANAALMRLCGLTPDTLPTTAHLALVVPPDRAALAQATTECLTGSGEPPAQMVQLHSRGGTSRPAELSLRRLQLGGQPAALVTCTDLSDFQHVQAMLLSTSNLLRQIVDGAPVASYVIDREHRVTHWNAACERLTGCSADQMIGQHGHWRAFYAQARPQLADLIVDGVDPLAMPEAWRAAGAAADGPASKDSTDNPDSPDSPTLAASAVKPSVLVTGAYEQEIYFSTPAPAGRWLNFTVAPLHDPAGATLGAIVTLQDVSQRRRTEEDLTHQLEQMVEARSAELAANARVMDAFIDNAPIGVVYAEQARVLRSNRHMAEIMGQPRLPEPQAQALKDSDFYLCAEDLVEVQRATLPALRRGLTAHHECWMRHANGSRLWLQINAYVLDHRDPHSGTWWMVQDRTAMRTAQEQLHSRIDELRLTNQKLEEAQNQLLQADKMASIGQLAAGVAHEINNPVAFVSSNLHSLRQYVASLLKLVDVLGRACQAPSDAALAQELVQVQRSTRLDELKEDLPQLLDESAEGLARVKKIVQDLKDFSRVDQSEWQQADLNAGLQSTLNVVRNELKYKAQVVLDLQPLPPVTCLAGQLNQVFLNLIVNASQAIAGQGTITLSSGSQDGWVWVQVQDTGCGMDTEVQRRVFEPFYTTKAVGKGTGLGLSLSFSIAKRHGGAIQLRSTPGQGSAFRLWVPVAGPAAQDEADPTAHQPPAWV